MSQTSDDGDNDLLNLFLIDDFDPNEWVDALLTRAILDSPGKRRGIGSNADRLCRPQDAIRCRFANQRR